MFLFRAFSFWKVSLLAFHATRWRWSKDNYLQSKPAFAKATSIKRLWKLHRPYKTKYSPQKHVLYRGEQITEHYNTRCYLATTEPQTLSGEDAFFRVPSLSGEEGLSLSTSMQTFLSREDIFRSKVLFFGETFATCGSSWKVKYERKQFKHQTSSQIISQ